MAEKNPLYLKQLRFGESREFSLEPKRIRVRIRNLNGENEYFVSYDSLSLSQRSVVQQNGSVLVLILLFGLFTFIALICGLGELKDFLGVAGLLGGTTVLIVGVFFYQRRSYLLIDLKNKQALVFLADRPSPEQLARFVEAIYQARKDFYREKYYQINPEDDLDEQLSKFKWLLREEIISFPEFQKMKSSLVKSRQKDKK
jgi:hypothetical protein